MAHEIDQTSDAQGAAMFADKPAWHRLGHVVSGLQTSGNALNIAGMNWTVDKLPCLYTRKDGTTTEIPNRYALVRSDTEACLGVMSDSYRVYQNVECFQLMDALVGEGLAMYDSCGCLRGGKKVWILARIPREYRIAKDDVIKPYTLLVNSHDGTGSLCLFDTIIRVVCMNTLKAAQSGRAKDSGINIPHWPNLDSQVQAARAKLGIVTQRLDRFAEVAQAMAAKQVSFEETRNLFKALFPMEVKPEGTDGASLNEVSGLLLSKKVIDSAWAKNEKKAAENATIVGQLLMNMENERNSLEGVKGSLWAALNAVTEFCDHQRPIRGKTEEERNDNYLNGIWFGPANDIKQMAWAAAYALVA